MAAVMADIQIDFSSIWKRKGGGRGAREGGRGRGEGRGGPFSPAHPEDAGGQWGGNLICG